MCQPADPSRFELIRARERAGLSVRSLARLIRGSYTYLSDVERGQATPSCRYLKRLRQALQAVTRKHSSRLGE